MSSGGNSVDSNSSSVGGVGSGVGEGLPSPIG
jgi:hypothetical protein